MTDNDEGTLQTFECIICDYRYLLKSRQEIKRITVECPGCGDDGAWCNRVE